MIKASVYLCIFLTGIVATLTGFINRSGTEIINSVLRGQVLPDYVGIFILMGVINEGFSKLTKVNRLVSGCVIACVIAILTNTIWSFLVSIFFAFSSYILGLIIVSLLKIKNQLPIVIVTLIGVGFYGTIIGLLAHFPINYPGLYGFMLALPIVLRWHLAVGSIFYLKRLIFIEDSSINSVIVAIALVHFSIALMPEIGNDALAVHLFVPSYLLIHHQWSFDVTNYVFAVMPMLGDWVYSIVYLLAGEASVRFINVGFLFALCFVIYELVIWAEGTLEGALWGILLFLTTPLIFLESSSAFIDLAWTAFLVSGSLLTFKAIEKDEQYHLLIIAGLMLGYAASTKVHTFAFLPILLLVLLLKYKRISKKHAAIGLILFLTVSLVPYITAWILTSNPVFPFANKTFQSPFYPAINFEHLKFKKGISWDFFYQITFNSSFLEVEGRFGSSGFQWLLLFFPSFLIVMISPSLKKAKLLYIITTLSIILIFLATMQYLRYILPAFVFGAASIGFFISLKRCKDYLFFTIFSITILLNLVFFKSATWYGDFVLEPLFGSLERGEYLDRVQPIRNTIQLVNQLNKKGTPVAVLSSSEFITGLESEAILATWYNRRFEAELQTATTAKDIFQVMSERGIDYVILDKKWGDADKRNLVENVTKELDVNGDISLRQLIYTFSRELLINPDFSHGLEGWTVPQHPQESFSEKITATVSAPLTQVVPIKGNRYYLNSVTAACKNHITHGRIQTNWLNAKSQTIGTSNQTFECNSVQTTYSLKVKAPAEAKFAEVYATSHTDIPIIFSNVSFKE